MPRSGSWTRLAHWPRAEPKARMPPTRKRGVAILGGGMAGLAAAWALSGPETETEFEVCVYEAEPYLGGKGASTRGVSGRIEEHGLHVWLGYYENAFRLIREVYGELDRPTTDPDCPIATWRDAFTPSDLVGVGDERDGTWTHWVASFSRNSDVPGTATDTGRRPLMIDFVERGLGLLLDFWASVRGGRAVSEPGSVVLSGSALPPRAESASLPDPGQILRGSEIAAMIGGLQSIRALRAGIPRGSSLAGVLLGYLERMRGELLVRVDRSDDARRSAALVDMVISAIIGILREGLLTDASGFVAIDDLDFREWLARQGARRETLESPLIRGMYDLVFAYADGDCARPRFPAGLGLFLAGKLFFEYRGSIFWRMQAGMGDVVFAPLYQALQARGVQFRFSHRIQNLHLTPDGSAIAAIDVAGDSGIGVGQPSLDRIKGLPCFVSGARSGWTSRAERKLVLKAGVDFDDVVLATSLAPIRSLGAELLADSARWRAMLDGVTTVPTQSLQVWLREDEHQLGWRYPGATVSGYTTPFDTYASMSHLIEREAWPSEDQPRTLGYFCSVLEGQTGRDEAHRRVRGNAVRFLENEVAHLWPGSVAGPQGFRWELLCGADGMEGSMRLDSQYWRANVEPAMRYVQALPGTGRLRLRANGSGFENLFLAGDWIDCGLNAGCIEAAVLAGLQAANAICGRPLAHGIVGSWIGLENA
ncbi:MAG: FAD-dependent oxidoreductase [Solirubrobacterales bacterium]|nr:FAD-dependent oxidoreductase [Solirubrobacterales bacterium]